MLGTIVTAMTSSAINNALPSIMSDFNVSASAAQWLFSGYNLVAGIMIPATAFMINRINNKTLFLSAMLAFAFGSILAAVSLNFPILLIGRIIQACGYGILMSFVQVIIMAMYPKERHGSIMGTYSLGVMVAPVIAPTITGFIIDLMGWHMVFVLFAVLAIIDIVLAILFMKNITETGEQRFDTISMILAALGFGGLLIGLGNLSSFSLFSVNSGLPIAVGAACLILFTIKQLKPEHVLLDLRVFRYKTFTIPVIFIILLYFMLMGNSVILPLFIQDLRGYTAVDYAMITLPGSIISAIFTLVSGKLLDKIGAKPPLCAGMLLMIIGCIMRFGSNGDTSMFIIGLSYALISGGSACCLSPANTYALSNLSGDDRVHGSAISAMLRQVAGAIGSAVCVAVMSLVAAGNISLGEAQAQMNGISAVYVLFCVLSAVCFALALFCIGNKKKTTAQT